MTTRHDAQFPVARSGPIPPTHRHNGGDVRGEISPRSRPEEPEDDPSDEEATDSSGSDSEEETIISEEVQEDNAQQLSAETKSDVPVIDKLQVPTQHDKHSATSVPPALIGEIRKMIQAESKSHIARHPMEERPSADIRYSRRPESNCQKRAIEHGSQRVPGRCSSAPYGSRARPSCRHADKIPTSSWLTNSG